MSLQLIFQGLIEIGISLITGLLIFFGSFKFFDLLTRNINELDELKKNNSAIAILVASFVFGVMILIKEAISPAVDTLGSVMESTNIQAAIVIFAILRILAMYLVAAIFSFLILWVSMKLFMLLTTTIDEMEEIKKNNAAIAIIIGVLIISVTLILATPLKTFLDGFKLSPRITPNEPFFNLRIIIQGLIELGISFFGVIFIFFFSFKVFNLLTKNIDEIKELKSNNIAISVLLSSFLFGMMIIIKASIEPSTKTLEHAITKGGTNIIFGILSVLIFFILSAVLAFVILWLAMKAFMLLTTSIDEMAQIKSNNIAVAIIIAVLLISAAILLSHGLTILLKGLDFFAPKVESGLQGLP